MGSIARCRAAMSMSRSITKVEIGRRGRDQASQHARLFCSRRAVPASMTMSSTRARALRWSGFGVGGQKHSRPVRLASRGGDGTLRCWCRRARPPPRRQLLSATTGSTPPGSTMAPFINSPDWMRLPLTGYPDFSLWQPFLDEIITHPTPVSFRKRRFRGDEPTGSSRFISYSLGFFHDGHRAASDCRATLHALFAACRGMAWSESEAARWMIHPGCGPRGTYGAAPPARPSLRSAAGPSAPGPWLFALSGAMAGVKNRLGATQEPGAGSTRRRTGSAGTSPPTPVSFRKRRFRGDEPTGSSRFISYSLGFFHDGHRAASDCRATLHALFAACRGMAWSESEAARWMIHPGCGPRGTYGRSATGSPVSPICRWTQRAGTLVFALSGAMAGVKNRLGATQEPGAGSTRRRTGSAGTSPAPQ